MIRDVVGVMLQIWACPSIKVEGLVDFQCYMIGRYTCDVIVGIKDLK